MRASPAERVQRNIIKLFQIQFRFVTCNLITTARDTRAEIDVQGQSGVSLLITETHNILKNYAKIILHQTVIIRQ